MLEIGAVVAAGRQQHHDRVFRARRRHGAQVFDQPLGIVADGRDALPGEGVGKEPHHDLAVLEHIGDARGRAHIVLEHEEVALSGADQIDAGDMGVDVVRRLDADHLGPEGGIEQNELGRHKTRLEDLLVVIDVVEEDVDRLDALDAAPLDQIPFGAVEDAGDEVEGDQTFGRAAFSINGEGDAEPAKQLLGGVLLGGERIRSRDCRACRQGRRKRAGPCRPARASRRRIYGAVGRASRASPRHSPSQQIAANAPVLALKATPKPKLGALPCYIFRHLKPMPSD